MAIPLTPEDRRILENQTAIMGALSILLLHLVGREYNELQRSRLGEAIALTRNMTEASPMRSSVESEERASDALREANTNREHLRRDAEMKTAMDYPRRYTNDTGGEW